MVTRHRGVLLVRAVVLLIQNDQAQRFQGNKHGGAGSHHHQRLFRRKTAAPGPDPFGVTTTAVVLENAGAKTFAAAVNELGDQSDLGGEQQDMPAPLQLLGRQLEVHLGLAGAGDSPQQQTSAWSKLLVGLNHGLLLRGQGLGRLLGASITCQPVVLTTAPLPHQVTLLNQRSQQLGAKATGHKIPLPSAIALALQPSQKLPLARGGLVRVIGGSTALDPPHLTPPSQGALACLTNPTSR